MKITTLAMKKGEVHTRITIRLLLSFEPDRVCIAFLIYFPKSLFSINPSAWPYPLFCVLHNT